MSRYLQRIAASVLNPDSAIHPIVRPIFAASWREDSLDMPAVEESILVTDPRPQARQTPGYQPVAPAAGAQQRAAATTSGETPSVGAAKAASAALVPSLAPNARSESLAAPEAKAADQANRQAPAPTRTVEPEPASTRHGYVPLVRGNFSPQKPADPVPVPSRFPNPQRRESLPPSRSGDEVEIHIGRIEITATHPQVSRGVAPKPVRYAQSLDEYLNRRDGRRP